MSEGHSKKEYRKYDLHSNNLLYVFLFLCYIYNFNDKRLTVTILSILNIQVKINVFRLSYWSALSCIFFNFQNILHSVFILVYTFSILIPLALLWTICVQLPDKDGFIIVMDELGGWSAI